MKEKPWYTLYRCELFLLSTSPSGERCTERRVVSRDHRFGFAQTAVKNKSYGFAREQAHPSSVSLGCFYFRREGLAGQSHILTF
jgi:hypothetical protein